MFELGMIAGIVAIVAFIPYIWGTLNGKTKPNKTTWITWATIDFFLLLSFYAVGAGNAIWVPIALFIGAFVTAALSLKYGEPGWSKLDVYCLTGGILGVILWLIFSEPLVALIINLFVLLIGAIPTIKKTYIDPSGEDRLAWILFLLSSIINLFAIEQWIFAIAIYPIVMFFTDGTIAALALRTKKR